MSRLSQYFQGVAVKRLSAVETDPQTSNQHEFNGIRAMANLFGRARNEMATQYIYLGEDETRTSSAEGNMTWYDARENHATRTEYRLYFQSNLVMELASESDLLVIGKRADGSAMTLIVKAGSSFEQQVLWLFGVTGEENRFVLQTMDGNANREVGYAERTILETLGIETIHDQDENWLDMIFARFGSTFPKTREFSLFTRDTLDGISALDDPDAALLAWINQEEMLFKTLERYIVQERLEQGFAGDVDSFIQFSLSVHNRRKSRMGYSLENHLEHIFIEQNLRYSREKMTENRKKPDFVFPEIDYYRQNDFPVSGLTMLGAKSTCKDRWRQVLSEAARIEEKHLLTLEPGISMNQTEEMQASNLQLVLPTELHQTYTDEQRGWLINLDSFIRIVRDKQRQAGL